MLPTNVAVFGVLMRDGVRDEQNGIRISPPFPFLGVYLGFLIDYVYFVSQVIYFVAIFKPN